MNPLTQIRNTQKATRRERDLGLLENASWHERFKHSAYIYVGGLDYELTEGDILAVFAQYGEIVDVNLVRDKDTGKSRGFAFLAYENQKSTILAVDNLSGARVAGRIIRVEHVDDYKRKRQETESDEEIEKKTEKAPRAEKTEGMPHAKEGEAPVATDCTKLKREMVDEGGGRGSLFEMMNAHLKKKQKSFPPAGAEDHTKADAQRSSRNESRGSVTGKGRSSRPIQDPRGH